MQPEYKKKVNCKRKHGYWIQKHNFTLLTHVIFADAVIGNIVCIYFITVAEHTLYRSVDTNIIDKWSVKNMLYMKKKELERRAVKQYTVWKDRHVHSFKK